MINTPALRNPVFCALDTSEVGLATSLAAKLADSIGGVKLGLQFYSAVTTHNRFLRTI